MQKILLLLSHPEDAAQTSEGLQLLRDFRIGYESRCLAAELETDYLKDVLENFRKQGGAFVLCFTAPENPLPLFAAAFSTLPVLRVANRDVPSLPLPDGALPIASFGSGAKGFTRAAHFALQILAGQNQDLQKDLQRYRHSLGAQMIARDQKYRISFEA